MLPINKYSSILTLSDLAVRQRLKETPLSLDRGLCGFNHVPQSMPKTALPRQSLYLNVAGFFFGSDRLARRDNQDTRARGKQAMRERLRACWGGEGQSPYPKVCRVNVAPKGIVLKELREGWVPFTKGHPA
jgi:hypothetical protein